jgi:aryl-alcohol dehydrogenase
MELSIHAAVLRDARAPLQLEELTLAEPQDDELRVRIVACGICHTDVACRDAVLPVPMPIVLGHEGAGVVEEVGRAILDVERGDHVLLSFGYCGHCPACLRLQAPYCDHFTDLNFSGTRADGTATLRAGQEIVQGSFFGQSSFASHTLVKRRNAVRIDKSLPLPVLAPLGCGVQTGAGAVLNTLRAAPGDSIVIFGVGAVGLSAVMAAKVAGCSTIVAVDRVTARLETARELGATHVIEGSLDPSGAVRAQAGAVDAAIDTTGIGEVIAAAVKCLRARGSCVLLGLSPTGVRLPLDVRYLVRNGINIRGVVEGDSQPEVFLPRLIRLFEAGQFPIDRLIREYPFREINEALAASSACEVIKPVLRL